MQANPNLIDFKPYVQGKKTNEENICFEIDGIRVQPENEVKLVGVTIDFELKFSSHRLLTIIIVS